MVTIRSGSIKGSPVAFQMAKMVYPYENIWTVNKFQHHQNLLQNEFRLSHFVMNDPVLRKEAIANGKVT